MKVFLIIGVVMTLAGLAGVLWCIRRAAWLRSADVDADAVRSHINKLIFAHMASFGTALMGLALVVVGVLLS